MGLFKRNKSTQNLDNTAVEDVLIKALMCNETISRESAMSLPAVSGTVELICNLFAMIPFKLYHQDIDEKGQRVVTEIENDVRVSLINDDTYDTMDGVQFKKALCEDYLLSKGGYAYINRSGNDVLSIHYVESKFINILKNYDPIFKKYVINVNGINYDDFEFVKLLRNTKDGAEGVGLVEQISTALQSAVARLKYDYELAKTGGSRKGFLKSKNRLSKEALKALKDAWDKYYEGNSSTVILNDGVEFQEASNTSKENEISQKEISFSKQIKDMFHIGNTYDATIKNAVMPIVTAFCSALNKDLLLESEKKDYYFEADTRELYKGSMKERFEAYKIAIETGFKTRNEIRYIENDNYIEGLDTVNLGLGDVLMDSKTGAIYIPNTGKTFSFKPTSQTEGGENDENNS